MRERIYKFDNTSNYFTVNVSDSSAYTQTKTLTITGYDIEFNRNILIYPVAHYENLLLKINHKYVQNPNLIPKDKEDITGYQWEPWHIRYIGEKAAKDLYQRGITFDEYYACFVEGYE